MTPFLAGSLIKLGGDLIDNLFETDAEKANARAKLLQLEQEGRLAQTKLELSVMLAEAKSKDKWTSRARPAFLYVVYLIFILCIFGSIIGIWRPDEVMQAAANMEALFNAIPDQIIWLFGSVMMGYNTLRTVEKTKGVAR